MKRVLMGCAALIALAACEPQVPDSGAGVGFNDYDSYQAQQQREAAQAMPGAQAVTEVPLEPADSQAAAVAAAFGDVPVEHDDDVVEPVIAHHALVARGEWQADRTIVVGVSRRVAPAEIGADGTQCKTRRRIDAVAAPVAAEHFHRRSRRRAVAFALVRGDTGAPERTAHDAVSGNQQPLRGVRRPGPHGQNQPAAGDISAILVAVTDFGV